MSVDISKQERDKIREYHNSQKHIASHYGHCMEVLRYMDALDALESRLAQLEKDKLDMQDTITSYHTHKQQIESRLADAERENVDLQRYNEELYARARSAERRADAAIESLRQIGWCAGCKYFEGLKGCGISRINECTDSNDLYKFKGIQPERKE